MKGPDQRARFRVERSHFAGCHLGATIVGNERSNDDELPSIGTAIKSGWRTDAVFTVILRSMPEAYSQIDRAFVAEAGPELPGDAVDGNQPCISGTDENRVSAERDAAIREIAVISVARHIQIGFPDFMTRFRVERDDESAGRRDVEFAFVIYGCGFKARIAAEVVDGFASVVGPDGFQACNVGWRDWINLRAGEQENT